MTRVPSVDPERDHLIAHYTRHLERFRRIPTHRREAECADAGERTCQVARSPYAEWIVARIEGRRDSGNWLDGFPLRVAAAWCQSLGFSTMRTPPHIKLTSLDRIEACDVGFGIA